MPSSSLASLATLSFLLSFLRTTLAGPYVWPYPNVDAMEEYYVNNQGHNAHNGFHVLVNPCNFFAGGPSGHRADAPEWIRLAYHDIATYDVSTGLGGLDASIVYETDRAENLGKGMNDSLFSLPQPTGRMSESDIIAMALVVAVGSCNGPQVPMSVGRVDATKAGPFGVPGPEQSLASHTANFLKQGFNQTEMIALVACGHALGGVHGVDFPPIIPPGSVSSNGNPDRVVHFQSHQTSFTNKVVTDYISGNTTNPLVVGPDVTRRSDARIFAADGNATMRHLASSQSAFFDSCSTLFERLINTVPAGTNLTPLTPIPIKPHNMTLSIVGSSYKFAGEIRLMADSTSTVVVHYLNRTGQACSTCSITAQTSSSLSASGPFGALNFYSFSASIPLSTGISAFWVEVQKTDGTSVVETNGGGNFPMTDSLVFMPKNYTVSSTQMKVVAASLDSANIVKVHVELMYPLKQQGAITPRVTTFTVPASKKTALGTTGYTQWSVTIPLPDSTFDHRNDAIFVISGTTADGSVITLLDHNVVKP